MSNGFNMDYFKLYGKHNNENERRVRAFKVFNNCIGMEYSINK